MLHSPKFELIFAPETVDHLDAIERRFHRLIQRTIDEQLTRKPSNETRNRKPMDQPGPFAATWELRFGPKNCFRVFYEIDDTEQTVQILAIGIKDCNRLLIGGEEFTL